jgi:hypothetical protein
MEARVATVRAGGYAAHRRNLTAIKVALAPAMQALEAGLAAVEHPIDKPRQGEAKLFR